jgi:hypothetical protein
MKPALHQLSLPGAMLARGLWLMFLASLRRSEMFIEPCEKTNRSSRGAK